MTRSTAAVTMSRRIPEAAYGPLLALSAGVMWSLGSSLARVADRSDAFQYLLWRSVGIIVVVELLALASRRGSGTRRAFSSGWRMVAANLTLLCASLGFVYALKVTSAANAAFLGATGPIFAALLGWFFLGERPAWHTMAAIAAGVGGVLIILGDDLSGERLTGDMAGNLAALGSGLAFAGYGVVVRSRPHDDWSPVLPGYGVVMIAICAIVTIADSTPITPDRRDVLLALVHGAVFIVGGTTVFNLASRHVPAAAMIVFAQSETVLVPVWAFVLLGERPGGRALLGGAVIMTAVLGKAAIDAHQHLRADETVPSPTVV